MATALTIMADNDTYGPTDVSADEDYARQFEQAQLDARRREQASVRAAQKRQPNGPGTNQSAQNNVADEALEAVSRSPVAANPWVRIILFGNNILNRLTGKPPNSAENITLGVQVMMAAALLLVLLQAILVFTIVFLLVTAATNPGLIFQAGLCAVFGGVVALFNSTVCSLE